MPEANQGWSSDDVVQLIMWGSQEAMQWYSTVSGKPIATTDPAVVVGPTGASTNLTGLVIIGLVVLGGVYLLSGK